MTLFVDMERTWGKLPKKDYTPWYHHILACLLVCLASFVQRHFPKYTPSLTSPLTPFITAADPDASPYPLNHPHSLRKRSSANCPAAAAARARPAASPCPPTSAPRASGSAPRASGADASAAAGSRSRPRASRRCWAGSRPPGPATATATGTPDGGPTSCRRRACPPPAAGS